jgi:hypothetical protein
MTTRFFRFWKRGDSAHPDKKVSARIRVIAKASEYDIAVAILSRADPALADALEDIGKLCEARRLSLGCYRRARHVEAAPPTADLPFADNETASPKVAQAV